MRLDRSRLRLIGSIVVMPLMLAFAVYYLIAHWAEFESLRILNPYLLGGIAGLILVGYWVSGEIARIMLRPLQVRIGVWESFQLAVVTGFYNIITPFKGGLAIRAIYMKRVHDFSYTHFVSSLGGSYVLTFFVTSATGLAAVLYLYLTDQLISIAIAMIFALVLLITLGIIVFSPTVSPSENPILRLLGRIIGGWNHIKADRTVLAYLAAFTIIQVLVGAITLMLQFTAFGINISIAQALFLTSLGSISLFLQITPAGLGISEAILIFSASTLGISTSESFAAAILGRGVNLAVSFILGPLFSWYLIKRTGRKIRSSNSS
jgi:uncharacterized membrane protein YbhN (UPF0104 family)